MTVHPSQASHPSLIEESPSSYSTSSLPSSYKDQQSSISLTITPSINEVSSTSSSLMQEQEQQHKRFNCFYCDQAYSSDKERVKHIDYQHSGKLYYPTPEDLEASIIMRARHRDQ